MKSVWLAAGISVGLLTGAAVAADVSALPGATPIPTAPSFDAEEYDWDGAYAGVQGGWGWGDSDFSATSISISWPDLTSVGDSYGAFGIDGFFGGGFAGYNHQMGGLLVGVEASANYAGFGYSIDTSLIGGFDDIIAADINFVATVAGRLGLVAGNWLFYGKAGYAGGTVTASVEDSAGGNQGAWSGNGWLNGYTVGGGVNVLIRRHILGFEYGFYDLGGDVSALDSNSALQVFNLGARFHTVVGRVGMQF